MEPSVYYHVLSRLAGIRRFVLVMKSILLAIFRYMLYCISISLASRD